MSAQETANQHTRDMTESKSVRDTLAESQRRFQAIFDNSLDAILLRDDASRYVDANPAACELLGYRREELLQLTLWDLTPVQDRARIPELLNRLISDGTLSGEYTLLCKGGATREVEYRAVANILPGLHLAIHRDITERKQAEEAILQLAAIVQSSDDAIISKTPNRIIVSWNRGAEGIYGYTAEEAIGRSIRLIIPPDYTDKMSHIVEELLRGKPSEHYEVVRKTKDGRLIDVSLSSSLIRDSNDRITGVSTIGRDITERNKMERAVLEIATTEQRRIGQELHDNTGQELTALSLLAATLAEKQSGRSPAEVAIVAKIVAGLDRINDQVRAIARGLIPVEVDSRGLPAALEQLAARISELNEVTCTFDCGGESVGVEDNRTATHLFHIAQEAVTNALRHGKASHITLRLLEDANTLTLQIEDDGVGFPPEPMAGEGMGLKIMHYRASLFNSQLTVGPAEPVGTAVTCKLLTGVIHEQKH